MPVATGNETRAETVAAFAEEARGRNWTAARRQRRAQVLRGLCLLGTVLVLRAPEAAGYLFKSHMYWERIGAHPHYVNTPVQLKMLVAVLFALSTARHAENIRPTFDAIPSVGNCLSGRRTRANGPSPFLSASRSTWWST